MVKTKLKTQNTGPELESHASTHSTTCQFSLSSIHRKYMKPKQAFCPHSIWGLWNSTC